MMAKFMQLVVRKKLGTEDKVEQLLVQNKSVYKLGMLKKIVRLFSVEHLLVKSATDSTKKNWSAESVRKAVAKTALLKTMMIRSVPKEPLARGTQRSRYCYCC